MTPRSLPALLALLLLAACGDGLYDAAGLPVTTDEPAACGADLVRCDAQAACELETVDRCGTACAVCPAGPAGKERVCNLGRAPDGHGQCGYACADGFFACGEGDCCAVTAVAAGGGSSYAVVSDGSVRAWGANDHGQLGDGSTVDRPLPALVITSGASSVAAGPAHACAVIAGGAVRCWGANGDGQVTGASASAAEPSPSATPVSAGAIAVAAGGRHTCALLDTGAVTCWGALAQTAGASSISGATAVAAGASHTCAVVAGGAVKCWGAGANGQLGGVPSGGVSTPIGAGIVHLAASADHTCAASGTSTGEALDDALLCWGAVLGAAYHFAEPAQLTPLDPRRDVDRSTIRAAVSAVAAGRSHVCVRDGDGVQCLGPENGAGQLGAVTPEAGTATLVNVGATTALAAGADHACALLATGAVRCWGSNAAGQLGDGTSGSGATPEPGTLVPPKGT